jgi:hypothetical protein
MLAKLGGLRMPPERAKPPDISLLSPADQDRVVELFRKNRNSLNGVEPSITQKEFKELLRFTDDLPTLGPDDRFAGPKIEVRRDLKRYWGFIRPAAGGQGYFFENLGKVETLRFIELCDRYGAEQRGSGVRLRDRMVPLAEWQPDDKAEMEAMLEKAARRESMAIQIW